MEKVTERKLTKKEEIPYASHVGPSGREEEAGRAGREEEL